VRHSFTNHSGRPAVRALVPRQACRGTNVVMSSFPFYQQLDAMDCGPTCLRMVAKHYGRAYSLNQLREYCNLSREGVSLLGISEGAEKIGFHTMGTILDFQQLASEVTLPCIVHWEQGHFVVIHKISTPAKSRLGIPFLGAAPNKGGEVIHVADPVQGLITYHRSEFMQGWASTQERTKGVALLLEPTPQFFEEEAQRETGELGFGKLFEYVLSYLLLQLVLGLILGSVLQLILPFLTQSVVDIGINTQNLSFVYLILFAQLFIFAGRTSVDFIRSWILLNISTRVNLSILSDFLIKLMRLPLAFFDVKMMGDLMQRISDQRRIETFLTTASLSTLFSFFNLLVFGVVLALYSLPIFGLFLAGSVLYGGWVLLFLRSRRSLDLKMFQVSGRNQSTLVQLLQGIQEIKLSNSEMQKRWEWERLQARLFKLNTKGLALNQYQQAGAVFLNEGKNIFITFFAAKAVISGELTLGAMLAIQYIIGQLNSPIEQLAGFMQSLQDAKISLERLNEIHTMADEEPLHSNKPSVLPQNRTLHLEKVSFHYAGTEDRLVLNDVSLQIPAGQTLAIVGASGSGKTTLLKLLLKFYTPTSGEIRLGDSSLQQVSHKLWRSECGVVMQEGYIFSDTIANNITVGDEYPDQQRLRAAVRIANIQAFVEALPLGFNTKIGMEGNGISQGQRQRILIARAVYKDPSFLFFDEATNALDTENESIITRNLNEFYEGRTVIIVAHRLSTVREAHRIIVLHQGAIVEQGTHAELTARQGYYYQLVRNQLELENGR
jgi:ATP-binding cassette subfamily B protein